jgi:hypothetical protein
VKLIKCNARNVNIDNTYFLGALFDLYERDSDACSSCGDDVNVFSFHT